MENYEKPLVIKPLEEEYYKPVMFYNTTLRNVGLFSSISLTVMAIAASTESKHIQVMLRLLALLILTISGTIVYGLHKTFNDMKTNKDVENYMKHWNYITYIAAVIILLMIIYDIYKLYKEQKYLVSSLVNFFK